MLFVLGCLVFFVAAFLMMLCVQALRIEKTILDTVENVEAKVTRLYNQGS